MFSFTEKRLCCCLVGMGSEQAFFSRRLLSYLLPVEVANNPIIFPPRTFAKKEIIISELQNAAAKMLTWM